MTDNRCKYYAECEFYNPNRRGCSGWKVDRERCQHYKDYVENDPECEAIPAQ